MYEFSDEYFSKEYKSYLEVRDKGLKKEGNKILENLMLYFNKLDESVKIAIVDELFTFRFDRFPRLSEFQHQLHIQIFPILEKMCSENKMPHLRWHYEISENVEMLNKAYRHEDCDEKTVELMAYHYFDCFEQGLYDIQNGIFAKEQYHNRLLDEINEFIQRHSMENTHWQEAHEYYRELFSNWHKYNSENTSQYEPNMGRMVRFTSRVCV